MARHLQVTNGGLDAGGERLGDDGAMALGRVTLVAQKRDVAGELGGERIEERPLAGQVLAEIAEVAPIVAIGAQLMADLLRRAERAFVTVIDAGITERRAQCAL